MLIHLLLLKGPKESIRSLSQFVSLSIGILRLGMFRVKIRAECVSIMPSRPFVSGARRIRMVSAFLTFPQMLRKLKTPEGKP